MTNYQKTRFVDDSIGMRGYFLKPAKANGNGHIPAKTDIPTDVEYITDEDAEELEKLLRTQDWELK